MVVDMQSDVHCTHTLSVRIHQINWGMLGFPACPPCNFVVHARRGGEEETKTSNPSWGTLVWLMSVWLMSVWSMSVWIMSVW